MLFVCFFYCIDLLLENHSKLNRDNFVSYLDVIPWLLECNCQWSLVMILNGRTKTFYYLSATQLYYYESIMVKPYTVAWDLKGIKLLYLCIETHLLKDRQDQFWLLFFFLKGSAFKSVIMSCLFWIASTVNREAVACH